MSLYAQYLREREGLEVLETKQGFATYALRSLDCYIVDIYVVPECRKSGIAAGLADQITEIARARGKRLLTGSVDSRANGADASHAVLKAYGMKPYLTEDYMTYYSKEIA